MFLITSTIEKKELKLLINVIFDTMMLVEEPGFMLIILDTAS